MNAVILYNLRMHLVGPENAVTDRISDWEL